MNGQESWKTWYRSMHKNWYNKTNCRHEMFALRREAALERKCEALQRRVTELESTCAKVTLRSMYIDDGVNDAGDKQISDIWEMVTA